MWQCPKCKELVFSMDEHYKDCVKLQKWCEENPNKGLEVVCAPTTIWYPDPNFRIQK